MGSDNQKAGTRNLKLDPSHLHFWTFDEGDYLLETALAWKSANDLVEVPRPDGHDFAVPLVRTHGGEGWERQCVVKSKIDAPIVVAPGRQGGNDPGAGEPCQHRHAFGHRKFSAEKGHF